MITVKLYQFSKRSNSTKIPDNTVTSTEVTVLLKDDCSYENPVLILESSDPTTYNQYNYAYISYLGRYYFINSKSLSTGKRLILNLQEDYLASFKSEIQAQSGFIEYSSIVTNQVEDTRLATLATPSYSYASTVFTDTIFTSSGCVIISCTGKGTTGNYILQNISDIYDIFDNIDWTDLSNIQGSDTPSIMKSLGENMMKSFEQFATKDSATRNLRNAIMLPWVVHHDAIGSSVNPLYIGDYDTGKTVYKVADEIITDSVTLSIPWGGITDWRKCSKYTDIVIYLPLFGLQKLSVDQLVDDTNLLIKYSFSYNNGDVSYVVKGNESGHIVASGTTNASAPLAVGNSNINTARMASSIGLTLGSVTTLALGELSALGIAGAIGAGIGGAMGIVDAKGGEAIGGGGFGGFACAELDTDIKVWRFTKSLTDAPANMGAAYGYPRKQIGSLAGLSGYCKLSGFNFNGSGTLSEKHNIESYMNSGFYIE